MVNPSWEAVKLLQGIEIAPDYTCQTAWLPVEYAGQQKRVDALWGKYAPMLCVHVGVGLKGSFALERCCRVGPYLKKDGLGMFCGSGGECIVDNTPILCTRIDVDAVLDGLQAQQGTLEVKSSRDAGLYLCEYTYYLSSARREAPVIFVHVPPVGHPYSQAAIDDMLERILCMLVTKVIDNDGS